MDKWIGISRIKRSHEESIVSYRLDELDFSHSKKQSCYLMKTIEYNTLLKVVVHAIAWKRWGRYTTSMRAPRKSGIDFRINYCYVCAGWLKVHAQKIVLHGGIELYRHPVFLSEMYHLKRDRSIGTMKWKDREKSVSCNTYYSIGKVTIYFKDSQENWITSEYVVPYIEPYI